MTFIEQNLHPGTQPNFGMSETELSKLIAVLSAHPRIEEAVIYGSRAKGNNKRFSDIDLTLKGENLTTSDLFEISETIDDLLLPYELDLSLFSQLRSPALIDEINRTGIPLPINR